MARSGSVAAWEHRLAAQRREDDRLARERRQRERDQDKLRQQEYLEAKQQEAADKTAALEEQTKALDEVLASVLPLRPLSFDRLLAAPRAPDFDPGPLGLTLPAPDWNDFRPTGLDGFLDRFLGGARRHGRQLAQARARIEAAQAEHLRQESERRRALAVAKARYDQKVTEERAKATARNAYVTRRRSAFDAGDAEAVQWYVSCVLRSSRYPDGFPREYQVAYRPRDREVAVELELPARSVVPALRAYRYVKASDAIEPVPRQENEIRQSHERLIARVALRTLHEIFGATPPEVVRAVAFTGWVSAVDRATGQPARPRLLTVAAERSTFEALVLAEVDPSACLARLNAPAS
jgi:restriction system protein